MSAATLHLRDWVPALAKELHGKQWTPNHDMTTHLEAQQEARKLGIQWAANLPATDTARISDALRARYART